MYPRFFDATQRASSSCNSYFRNSRTGTSRRVNWIGSGSAARRVVVGSINMPAAYAINSIPTHPRVQQPWEARTIDLPPSTWTKHKYTPHTNIHTRAHTDICTHRYEKLYWRKNASIHTYIRPRIRVRCELPAHNPLFKIFTRWKSNRPVPPRGRRLTRLFVGGSISKIVGARCGV